MNEKDWAIDKLAELAEEVANMEEVGYQMEIICNMMQRLGKDTKELEDGMYDLYCAQTKMNKLIHKLIHSFEITEEDIRAYADKEKEEEEE